MMRALGGVFSRWAVLGRWPLLAVRGVGLAGLGLRVDDNWLGLDCLFGRIAGILIWLDSEIIAGAAPAWLGLRGRPASVPSWMGSGFMAGKSRRVASRQGELSRRRKRTQRGPSGIPSVRSPGVPGGSAAAMEAVAVGAAAGASATAAPPESAPSPAAHAASAGRPGTSAGAAQQSRGPVRARGERPAAYNYVGAELRRIGILSVVALGALIGLAFVL